LEDSSIKVIMQDVVGNVKYLAFLIPFFNKLVHNQEILIDATCKYLIYLFNILFLLIYLIINLLNHLY